MTALYNKIYEIIEKLDFDDIWSAFERSRNTQYL